MSKNKLDLLLVNPSAQRVYQKDQEKASYPALEPPYLAALTAEFVRGRGFNVKILDANVEQLSVPETVERIIDYDPKLMHMVVHGNQPSASSQLMDLVGEVSKSLKGISPKTKILLTGTHPASLPKRTLEEDVCDFVGRGEGFLAPLGILEGKPLHKIPGLWYKENGKIIPGTAETLMTSEELGKELPKAAWDLLPIEKYRAHDWHSLDSLSERQPYAAMYTSFGCPYKCTFCCINAPFNEDGNVPNTIRFRDPNNIVDEIEFLVNHHGINNLKFIDEMFVLTKRHYVTVAEKIVERGLGDKLNIWAYARVDTIHEGRLDLLRRAGIKWLALGIESGSKHVRDGVEKGRFGQEDIIKNVRKVQDAGIYVVGNFIFGLPDDDLKSMQETLDLAIELNCERPNFYSTMAYPGSELHRMAQRGEYPKPRDWDSKRALLPEDDGGPGWIGYSQHAYGCWPLPTEFLHPEQVLEFRDKALKTYFKKSNYINFLKRKFPNNTETEIEN